MRNTLNDSRLHFEKLGTQYQQAENIIIEGEMIEGISCYWLYKKGTKAEKRIIVYLHGGCFVLGSILSHQALVSHLANDLNLPILFIEYRLAPENPFPSAIDDILQVYQYILFKKQIKDMVIIGESAGAGLALSLISGLNRSSIPRPEQLVMLSPWVDLRCTNHSILYNAAKDPILTKEQLQSFTSMYIGSNKLSGANPVETMMGEFPPTLILVGSGEILIDDSRLAFTKISDKQPKTKLSIYEGQTHVWLLDEIQTEASKSAIGEIRKFING